MTDTEPTVEQIDMNINGFFFAYFGATLYIMTVEKTITIVQYKRKPEYISEQPTREFRELRTWI